MNRKSCVVYSSWETLIYNLPDEQAGMLSKAILHYGITGEKINIDDPTIKAVFEMVKEKIDEDSEKYQAKVDRAKDLKKSETKSERNRDDIVTKSKRNHNDIGGDTVTVSVTDTVSDTVTDNVNGYPSDTKKRGGNSARFTPPTVAEVRDYCLERNNGIDAEQFVDFYASKGWMVGKNKMKDWRSCVRTWERRDRASPKKDFDSNEYLLGIINGGDIYDGTRSG